MKKILIIVMIILLSVISYSTVASGYNVGDFQVLGIKDIQDKNNELNEKIQEANKKNTTTYQDKLNQLNVAAKELITKKKSYEELVSYSKDSDVAKAQQFQQYEVEVLWTKIGMYATKNGVVLKFDITESSNGTPNVNDLKFTATGSYISITDFVADLEKDAKLAFTIENFELVPAATKDTNANGRNLQATFKVKDIALNMNTTTISQQSNTTETGTTNTTNTNTVGGNTTTSSTNTNTTNTAQ